MNIHTVSTFPTFSWWHIGDKHGVVRFRVKVLTLVTKMVDVEAIAGLPWKMPLKLMRVVVMEPVCVTAGVGSAMTCGGGDKQVGGGGVRTPLQGNQSFRGIAIYSRHCKLLFCAYTLQVRQIITRLLSNHSVR